MKRVHTVHLHAVKIGLSARLQSSDEQNKESMNGINKPMVDVVERLCNVTSD
jgi:hypothetical protein